MPRGLPLSTCALPPKERYGSAQTGDWTAYVHVRVFFGVDMPAVSYFRVAFHGAKILSSDLLR